MFSCEVLLLFIICRPSLHVPMLQRAVSQGFDPKAIPYLKSNALYSLWQERDMLVYACLCISAFNQMVSTISLTNSHHWCLGGNRRFSPHHPMRLPVGSCYQTRSVHVCNSQVSTRNHKCKLSRMNIVTYHRMYNRMSPLRVSFPTHFEAKIAPFHKNHLCPLPFSHCGLKMWLRAVG